MPLSILPKNLQHRVEIRDSGCWEWQGSISSSGYGDLCVDGQHLLVHRYVYSSLFGEIPKGLVIWHTCDNRKCCNPYHLRLGTHFQNIMDKEMKGRGNRGERNGMSKLTRDMVESIRTDFIRGNTQAALARQYNVNRSCIWKVVHGTHWR